MRRQPKVSSRSRRRSRSQRSRKLTAGGSRRRRNSSRSRRSSSRYSTSKRLAIAATGLVGLGAAAAAWNSRRNASENQNKPMNPGPLPQSDLLTKLKAVYDKASADFQTKNENEISQGIQKRSRELSQYGNALYVAAEIMRNPGGIDDEVINELIGELEEKEKTSSLSTTPAPMPIVPPQPLSSPVPPPLAPQQGSMQKQPPQEVPPHINLLPTAPPSSLIPENPYSLVAPSAAAGRAGSGRVEEGIRRNGGGGGGAAEARAGGGAAGAGAGRAAVGSKGGIGEHSQALLQPARETPGRLPSPPAVPPYRKQPATTPSAAAGNNPSPATARVPAPAPGLVPVTLQMSAANQNKVSYFDSFKRIINVQKSLNQNPAVSQLNKTRLNKTIEEAKQQVRDLRTSVYEHLNPTIDKLNSSTEQMKAIASNLENEYQIVNPGWQPT